MAQITVLKADGEKEVFRREKLFESLTRSGADSELSEKVVQHIEHELINDISTSDIYRHAFSLLQKTKKPVAARYSLRRALVGFGPTGFPFEDYIGEILKARGYETETDKMVQGGCVEHEVDVIAWNKEKLMMCEVKFHNELGLKSDLKIALYVKARFDDLLMGTFSYGGKQRKLDEGWLITNTKFSTRALQYGECKGLRMMGWNYPAKGNLQDLIEEYKLHPVSCLTTITHAEKQELFTKNIVLCKSLKDDKSILKSLGIKDEKIREIEDEIDSLVL